MKGNRKAWGEIAFGRFLPGVSKEDRDKTKIEEMRAKVDAFLADNPRPIEKGAGEYNGGRCKWQRRRRK